MRVRATSASKDNNIYIKELDAIVDKGFEFDVTEDRFDILHGNNGYNLIFVEKVEDIVEEKPVSEPKKPKKTTK